MESTSTPQINIYIDKEKLEWLKYSISRFDTYYQSVNSKIALYITLSTFIITAASAGGTTIIKQLDHNRNGPVLTLIIIAAAVAIFFTIKASIPYLKNHRESIFYFGYVSDLSHNDYEQKVKNLTIENNLDDLLCQAQLLAKGLKSKYFSLQIAGYLLLVDFAFITILSLLIITNIQQ